MKLRVVADRLDARLDTDSYRAADYATNGLQVGDGDRDIEQVAFAVDGAVATAETAARAGADLLVAHHGIIWGGLDRLTGLDYERVRTLIEADLALYAVHLPLDGHERLGNAAQLAGELGMEVLEPFGREGGQTIGVRAHTKSQPSMEELGRRLEQLGHESPQMLPFGPETVEHVGLITGSGTDWLRAAARAGMDTLLTGEGKQQVYHEAREAGLNVVLAGHYATERYGVQALRELVDGWEESLTTSYIDHPTGL